MNALISGDSMNISEYLFGQCMKRLKGKALPATIDSELKKGLNKI